MEVIESKARKSSEKKKINSKLGQSSRKESQETKGSQKVKISIIPRTIFVLCCIVTAIYQIARVVQLYVQFPTVVDVTVKVPQELVEALPSITVCDSNTIHLTKLIQKFPELKLMLDKAGNRYKRSIILDNFKRSKLAENETLIRTLITLGTSAEKFIQYLNCDEEKWKKPNEQIVLCETIPIIPSYHYNAMCFTLFHQSSTYWKVGKTIETIVKKNPKNVESFIVNDNDERIEVEEFSPNEVIQLMLNFNPNESTNLYKLPGGSVFVSNTRDIPGMEATKYDIEPGHYYEIYVRRSTTHQLPAPFETNCTDYFNSNKQWVITNRKLRKPLSRLSCYQLCLAKEVVKCKQKPPLLYPPEVPYYYNNAFEELDIVWGLWLQEGKTQKHSLMKTACTQYAKPHCKRVCPQDCEQEHYNVVVQKQKWPFKEITESTTNEEIKEIQRLSSCCAFISLRYSTFLRTIHEHKPRYKPLELLSQIGGLMSMWIGVSVLSLWDIATYLFHRRHTSTNTEI